MTHLEMINAPNGILPRSVARITGISLLVGAAFALPHYCALRGRDIQ